MGPWWLFLSICHNIEEKNWCFSWETPQKVNFSKFSSSTPGSKSISGSIYNCYAAWLSSVALPCWTMKLINALSKTPRWWSPFRKHSSVSLSLLRLQRWHLLYCWLLGCCWGLELKQHKKIYPRSTDINSPRKCKGTELYRSILILKSDYHMRTTWTEGCLVRIANLTFGRSWKTYTSNEATDDSPLLGMSNSLNY